MINNNLPSTLEGAGQVNGIAIPILRQFVAA